MTTYSGEPLFWVKILFGSYILSCAYNSYAGTQYVFDSSKVPNLDPSLDLILGKTFHLTVPKSGAQDLASHREPRSNFVVHRTKVWPKISFLGAKLKVIGCRRVLIWISRGSGAYMCVGQSGALQGRVFASTLN